MRARYGDNAAFDRLLSAYAPLINSLVSEYSRPADSPDISDDLRQEAAIALYFSVLSYREDKGVSFGLYAKICVKNRLTSYVKKNAQVPLSRITSLDIDDFFEEPAADEKQQPLDLIISKENLEALKKRIRAQLSDYEYGVFMMYADGDTPKKISARTGKNVKSVYNTIQRVRKKLENI